MRFFGVPQESLKCHSRISPDNETFFLWASFRRLSWFRPFLSHFGSLVQIHPSRHWGARLVPGPGIGPGRTCDRPPACKAGVFASFTIRALLARRDVAAGIPFNVSPAATRFGPPHIGPLSLTFHPPHSHEQATADPTGVSLHFVGRRLERLHPVESTRTRACAHRRPVQTG